MTNRRVANDKTVSDPVLFRYMETLFYWVLLTCYTCIKHIAPGTYLRMMGNLEKQIQMDTVFDSPYRTRKQIDLGHKNLTKKPGLRHLPPTPYRMLNGKRNQLSTE